LKRLADIGDLPRLRAGDDLRLGAGDVHIWHYGLGSDLPPELPEAFRRLLSPEELERYARLQLPSLRRQFLATRALCRWVLSRYEPVRPTEWRFQTDPRGKPSVSAPSVSAPIFFSLSHTSGVIACAVSRASDLIGVDIERIDRKLECIEIAEHFFPEKEARALRRLTPERRREAFFACWALKESFAKARGIDLTAGLAGAVFRIDDPCRVKVSFVAPLDEQDAGWRFDLRRVGEQWILALAIRMDASTPLRPRAAPVVFDPSSSGEGLTIGPL
jgi:4'-phosphopantetheinyl transferase